MRYFLIILTSLCCAACGYRFERGEKVSVSIPYVVGDTEGQLTTALVRELAGSPTLCYSNQAGQWILSIKITDVDNNRIGFHYDRNPETGKLRKHLKGIESRLKVYAEVVVISSATEEIIYGPQEVFAEFDYDYVDQDSIRDLATTLPSGKLVSTESFSLGQLDAIEAAKADVLTPLYRKLARKIIDGLTTCCDGSD